MFYGFHSDQPESYLTCTSEYLSMCSKTQLILLGMGDKPVWNHRVSRRWRVLRKSHRGCFCSKISEQQYPPREFMRGHACWLILIYLRGAGPGKSRHTPFVLRWHKYAKTLRGRRQNCIRIGATHFLYRPHTHSESDFVCWSLFQENLSFIP